MSNRFEFIKSNADSVEKIQKIREACEVLGNFFETVIPESRERSLALTKLEESAMWANRAVCVNQDNAKQ